MITNQKQPNIPDKGKKRSIPSDPDEAMPLAGAPDRWMRLILNMAMTAKRKGIRNDIVEAVDDYVRWKNDELGESAYL